MKRDKMKLKEICLMAAAVSVLCVIAQPALATSVMRVEPSDVNTSLGKNFTVDITVDPAENEVYGASYTLHFDNTLLEATSQTQGAFLGQDGESTNVIVNKIDNTLGKIEYAESRMMGVDVGVNGSGVLTTITFQAIGVDGISPLELSDLDGELLYSTSSGSILPVIYNGTCKIEDTPEDTPTTTPTTTTTTTTTAPVQTPTTIPITPTPTATVIQTHTIPSTPSSSPTLITTSPTIATPAPPSEEKSEENNGLSGFKAAFAITGLLAVLILKRKNVRK